MYTCTWATFKPIIASAIHVWCVRIIASTLKPTHKNILARLNRMLQLACAYNQSPVTLLTIFRIIFYKNYENWQILDCINIYSLVNLDELLIINIVLAWKDLCIVLDGERLGLKQERTYFLVTFPCFFFPDLRYFFHDFFTFRIFV